MMAAILNSTVLDSAILNKKNVSHSFWLNLIMAAILKSTMLNLAILLSDILVLPLKLTHTCQDWFPPFAQKKLHSFILTQLDDGCHLEFCHLGFSHFEKKNFSHSFWLNLMMAAILKSAILDSDTAILDANTLLSSLRFTQKHSHSTLTLTQTKSIWLIWWWQPLSIMLIWIQPFCTKLWLKLIQSDSNSFILTQLDDVSHLEFCHLWFSHFKQQKKLHSFILTQLDDGSHLEFYHLEFGHLGFRHSSFSSETHSQLPRLVFTICTKNLTHSFWLNLMMVAIFNSTILDSAILHKKTSLIHSDSTWWWQPSWILPYWIQPLPSWIQTPCYLLSDSLKNTHSTLTPTHSSSDSN